MSLRIEMILSDVALEQIVAQVIAKIGKAPAPIVVDQVKPSPIVDPVKPVVSIVGDDKTTVVAYQRGLPGSRAGSMDVLFMAKEVLSVAFRTKDSGRGWISRSEYVGSPWYGDAWLSLTPNAWDPSQFVDSYSAPQSTNSLRVVVGENVVGFFRLEPNTDYFYNVRARPWDAAVSKEQFSVAISGVIA